MFVGKVCSDKNLYKFLLGTAEQYRLVEDKLELVCEEFNIKTTTRFLDEWEGALGIPDDCFDGTGTDDARRIDINAKFLADETVTVENFVDLASVFGIDAEIIPGILELAIFPDEKTARFTLIIEFDVSSSELAFPLEFPIPFDTEPFIRMGCFFQTLVPANVQTIIRNVNAVSTFTFRSNKPSGTITGSLSVQSGSEVDWLLPDDSAQVGPGVTFAGDGTNQTFTAFVPINEADTFTSVAQSLTSIATEDLTGLLVIDCAGNPDLFLTDEIAKFAQTLTSVDVSGALLSEFTNAFAGFAGQLVTFKAAQADCSAIDGTFFDSAPGLLDIDLQDAQVGSPAIESILGQLVVNGLSGGTIIIDGASNGTLTPAAATSKATLEGNGWTVTATP